MARIERGAPVSAERGGDRGRRDPALRARINRDQAYDEETPEGVVARRGGPADPPELDAAELLEVEGAGYGEGQQPDEWPLLLEGDVVYSKVTHTVVFDDDPSYFTYGIASRVQPEEEEEAAFERVAGIVNQRVIDMAYGAEQHILDLHDRQERQRRDRANQAKGLRPAQRSES